MRLACLAALCVAVMACGDDDAPILGEDGGTDAMVDAPTLDVPGVDAPTTDAMVDAPAVDAPGVDAPGDAPVLCGNRAIDVGEECDDGNTTPGDGCDASCQIEASATCGDGNLDAGEQCDDMNTSDGDGCSARCLIEPPSGCGDDVLDLAAGEECDDGNTDPGDGCNPSCQLEAVGAFCGDGMMDPGELCDDNNTANGDGCNPTCNLRGVVSTFVGDDSGLPSTVNAGRTDGVGTAATVGGFGTLAVDTDTLWFAQGGAAGAILREIDIATATVTTVANLSGAEGIATNGVDTVWVAGGTTIESIANAAPYTVTLVTGGGAQANHPDCATTPPAIPAGCVAYADGAPSVATFGGIRGLTWYGGFLWIVDPPAATIRRLDPSTGNVVTVAGSPFNNPMVPVDGVGSAARFESPRYIVSDGSGLLYIADTNGAAIRVLNTVTNEVTTLAGNGTASYVDGMGGPGGPARIFRPRGITSDGTSVYWVEFNSHTIRQAVTATLDVSTLLGRDGMAGWADGTGRAARLSGPFSVAFHFPSNSLFFLDGGNGLIRRVQ